MITPLLWLILFVGQTALAANLALTGTATQSSTLPHAIDFGPHNAIDGNTDGDLFNGSVTHTDTEADPWWQVDLGFEQEIESIIVWNRTDAAPERLADFILEVLDAGNGVVHTYTHIGTPGGKTMIPNLPSDLVGQTIRIRLVGAGRILSLAEVQIFGTPPCGSGEDLIALPNPGTWIASATYHDVHEPQRAIDNLLPTGWHAADVAFPHTLTVDMGAARDIGGIQVFPTVSPAIKSTVMISRPVPIVLFILRRLRATCQYRQKVITRRFLSNFRQRSLPDVTVSLL